LRRFVHLAWAALRCTAIAALLVGAIAYAAFLRGGPELEVWHRAALDEEFTADHADEVRTVRDYVALEDRLFAELDREVYDRIDDTDRVPYNRYARDSRSDPRRWSHDWNRTFQLAPDGASGGVLLLHGLTDSPYSMRSIGEHLAACKLRVVGLRLPGHGTAPSGLLDVTVEDMRAAVRMALLDLHAELREGEPLYIVGYSNGAALAVDYALDEIRHPERGPRATGLVLLSPAIAVSRLAAVGRIRTGISSVPGFERAAWQIVDLEFDPYKYSSFAFNGAGQTQLLTSSISRRVARLAKRDELGDFPPVLAFISTVDATVRVEAVVDALLEHLEPGGHELVLFDVNRNANVLPLMVKDPGPLTARLRAMRNRPFNLSVITNATASSLDVHEIRWAVAQDRGVVTPLGMRWPVGVSSLSHVSLPFPPDDPLYGSEPVGEQGTVRLGRIEVRGENGVIAVPPWVLMRQRSNPFHGYLLRRIDEFIARSQPAASPAPEASVPVPAPVPAPAPAGTPPST
jgi:alpha-beta hydrolase superfamily lysophospholipase